MKKCILLTAALLLCTASLFAQTKPLTPYEYGHRWYFSFQGGGLIFNSDYCSRLFKEGRGHELVSFGAGVALGYNFSDAHGIRVFGNYSRKTGVCEAFEDPDADPKAAPIPTYTYRFSSTQLFVDYVLNYNALAENDNPFTAKSYIGPGFAYTFDFTDPGHPEVWLYDPNLVPCMNMGFIFEYDFKDAFGFFVDLGLSFYAERYNGRVSMGFPVDMESSLQVGLIYNFPLSKNRSW